MRFTASVPLLVVLSLLVACSARNNEEAPGPETVDVERLAGEVDGGRVLEHARVLAEEIGPRVAGTEAEMAAIDYVADALEEFGYDVSVEPFSFDGDRFAPGFVETGETTLDAFSLMGSVAGEATGTLMFAQLGSVEDLETVDASRGVVIVDRGDISFAEKVASAEEAGAAAVIIVNNVDEPLLGGTLGTTVSIPVVGVSEGARAGLLMAAEGGLEATVTARDGEGESANVLAKAPGAGECTIVVGGHHDTTPGSPGANDNASGVGHVLELARVSAKDGPLPGLCFATFGGEESGLFGSQEMAREFAAAGTLPRAMLNFDVTGMGDVVEAIGTEELVEDVLAIGEAHGIAVERSSLDPNVGSDHLSFEAEGVPVLFLGTGIYEEIHSPDDVFALLEEDALQAVAEAGIRTLLDLYVELAGAE